MANVDPVLANAVAELLERHAAHAVVLYGSRAHGTSRADSDYDIAAFAPGTDCIRIARPVGDAFLDVFVYPERVLEAPAPEHFKLLGGRVLVDRTGQATAFLGRVEALHRHGPEALAADDVEMRRVWAHKMLRRASHGDPEGNFRRAWLLTALIEDCFAIRRRWYEGPKKALAWLQANEPSLFDAYVRALEPDASLEELGALVLAAYGPLH